MTGAEWLRFCNVSPVALVVAMRLLTQVTGLLAVSVVLGVSSDGSALGEPSALNVIPRSKIVDQATL